MKRLFSFLVCWRRHLRRNNAGPGFGSEARQTAKRLFATKCKNCHGADGSGNPAIAKMMNVTMKPLGSEADADVKTAVTAGMGKMKPIAGVAAGDLDNLIAYIHTLKK